MAEKLLDVNSSVYTSEKATPKMQAPTPCGSAGGSKTPKAKEMDVNKGGYSDEKGNESDQYKAFKM